MAMFGKGLAKLLEKRFGDEAASKGIIAYHGSPHAFDRFSMDSVGTGEGAQAFGHGLYFAGNEKVAKSYRDATAKGLSMNYNGQSLARAYLSDQGWDADKTIASLRNNLDNPTLNPKLHADNRAALEYIQKNGTPKREGHMYEAHLDVNPDQLLDWDKPVAEQPPLIQDAASDLYKLPRKQMAREGQFLHPSGPDESQQLLERGVPGLQYFDRQSRGAGEGTRNYVMFDDKPISILRRYAVPGAIGAGAATAYGASQDQADAAPFFTGKGVRALFGLGAKAAEEAPRVIDPLAQQSWDRDTAALNAPGRFSAARGDNPTRMGAPLAGKFEGLTSQTVNTPEAYDPGLWGSNRDFSHIRGDPSQGYRFTTPGGRNYHVTLEPQQDGTAFVALENADPQFHQYEKRGDVPPSDVRQVYSLIQDAVTKDALTTGRRGYDFSGLGPKIARVNTAMTKRAARRDELPPGYSLTETPAPADKPEWPSTVRISRYAVPALLGAGVAGAATAGGQGQSEAAPLNNAIEGALLRAPRGVYDALAGGGKFKSLAIKGGSVDLHIGSGARGLLPKEVSWDVGVEHDPAYWEQYRSANTREQMDALINANDANRSKLALPAFRAAEGAVKDDIASRPWWEPWTPASGYSFHPATPTHDKIYDGMIRRAAGDNPDYFVQKDADRNATYLRRKFPLRHEVAGAGAGAMLLWPDDAQGGQAGGDGGASPDVLRRDAGAVPQAVQGRRLLAANLLGNYTPPHGADDPVQVPSAVDAQLGDYGRKHYADVTSSSSDFDRRLKYDPLGTLAGGAYDTVHGMADSLGQDIVGAAHLDPRRIASLATWGADGVGGLLDTDALFDTADRINANGQRPRGDNLALALAQRRNRK